MALLKRWDFNVPIGHKKLKPFGAVKARRGYQPAPVRFSLSFLFSFFFFSFFLLLYCRRVLLVNFVLIVLSSRFSLSFVVRQRDVFSW